MLRITAVCDLMFGIYIFFIGGVLPRSLHQAIPFGRAPCQLYAWITVFLLLMSMATYAIMAYDRYRLIITPLSALNRRQLLMLFGAAAVFIAAWSTLPFLGLGCASTVG